VIDRFRRLDVIRHGVLTRFVVIDYPSCFAACVVTLLLVIQRQRRTGRSLPMHFFVTTHRANPLESVKSVKSVIFHFHYFFSLPHKCFVKNAQFDMEGK
jgi:hypothetical protein